MNRRELIIGLGASVIVPSAVPKLPELELAVTPDFENAIANVIKEYTYYLQAYGVAFLQFYDKFPYVRVCRPWEIYRDPNPSLH